MRYTITALCLFLITFISAEAIAQSVTVDEGFSDGDFTNSPTWVDSESKHIVNTSNMLQLDAPSETAEAVISTASTAAYGEWEVYIELDFNPSSSNLSRFYIISDSQDVKGAVDGYFVQIGDTEDEVSLYRQDGSSAIKIIDGPDGLVDTNPVSIRIRVTRDLDGNWELLADSLGGTSYNSLGTAADNTYTQSEFIGLFSDYTSTRSKLFEYDDIQVTKINPPLDIQNVTVVDNQTFDVSFNLDVDPASVQASDFTITPNIGNPGSTSTSGNVVQLTYSNSISGGQYILNVSTITDNDGNTINSNTSYSFQFFDSYAQGDIIINEFAYDYPPTINEEYIEIRNVSNKYLNLANWQIADNKSSSVIGSNPIPIEPDSFLVISADTTQLFNIFGDRAYYQAGFPAFNNTTPDAVQLITDTGVNADSLTYNSDWGGTDIALERRSSSAPSIYKENWGNSPNPNGGTPGTTNEIAEDNAPPEFTDLNILSTQTLQLVFNERLDQSGNYAITNSSISSVDQTTADTVELSLASELQNATVYTLSIENATDIFGNTFVTTDTSFTFYNPSPVDSGDVAINEFMYAPPASSSEYIELYNYSGKSLNLQGWTLSDNRVSFEEIISENQFIVPPDSFVVIAPDNTIESYYPNIALLSMGDFPALNNGGDQIIIRDQNGVLLDSLQYTSYWGGDEVALERRTVDASGSYQSNWGNSPNGFGTPGFTNEVKPDQTPPDISSLNVTSNTSIQIGFNEPILKQTLHDPNNYQLSGSIAIDQATINTENSVTISLASALKNAMNYQLTLDGIQDIYSNTLSNRDTTFTFYEISVADSGEVFISEFLSVPPSGSTEYIELRNTTTKSFDLQNWTINDNTGNRKTITSQQFVLPPDSAVVIAPDQTLKNNFPEITLVAMGSSFPSLNNGGDDIVIKTSNSILIDSLRYQSNWGTDEVALERRSFNLSAIYQNNWGIAPNGFGTPGTPNEIEPDTQAPTLEQFQIQSDTELALIFSEQLDENLAKDLNNYSISNALSVAGAQFSAPDTVLLALDNQLQNAETYTLGIKNIADLFGNIISAVDTSFTYYKVSNADSGDVFVNEFNFAPSPGNTEYIEFYNPSNESFNLQGWSLSDNRGIQSIIANTRFIIPPDSFVVIAPDNTLLTEHPNIALVTMSNFPALNNGGDQIVLRNQNGTLLDSLQYTSDWGGEEVALERRTTAVSGTFRENWSDAPNGFGSPGSQNEVRQDQTPPTLEILTSINNNKIELTFSEKIASSSATNVQNYQLSPSIGIQLISAQDETVILFLEQALVDGQTYEVTVSNISDIFGNTLKNITREFEFLQIDEAQSGQIVINEILYNPGSEGKADFIELYNTTDKNFNLTGWDIGDFSSETTIQHPLQLEAGEYIVLSGNQNFASGVPSGVAISRFPSLNNNTPDDIYIRNKNGITIDSLRYHQSWGGSTDGASLERKDPLGASNDASNWQTNNSEKGISAGNQNITFQEDTDSPAMIFSKILSNGNYEIRFNEFIRLTDNTAFYTEGEQLSIAAYDSTNANVILLSSAASKSNNINSNSTTIRVENLNDVKGNTTASSEISVAQPLQNGDLVVNEIMFNPLAETDDNQPDQTEYIELHNTQDYAISLEGLFLHDKPDENGDIRDIQPVSTTAKWVPPQGYVLVHADESANFEESQTAVFFDLSSPSMQSIIRADRSSLSLASSNDAIYIADSTGATIDSVFYDESWHNPNIIDTRGIALERISPDGPSNDNTNWGSSVTDKGGTPKSENSIYQEDGEIIQETGISFNPNPFSPDDDGYEDNLFINYKLDEQDYLIKVRIYDRYGRLVRTLANGEQAGFEGQLIWNGRKDNNSRNRIGIYIVVFEAYDSASGNDVSFKKTVVLARQLN